MIKFFSLTERVISKVRSGWIKKWTTGFSKDKGIVKSNTQKQEPFSIPVETLAKGIYFLEIVEGNNIAKVKLVKN